MGTFQDSKLMLSRAVLLAALVAVNGSPVSKMESLRNDLVEKIKKGPFMGGLKPDSKLLASPSTPDLTPKDCDGISNDDSAKLSTAVVNCKLFGNADCYDLKTAKLTCKKDTCSKAAECISKAVSENSKSAKDPNKCCKALQDVFDDMADSTCDKPLASSTCPADGAPVWAIILIVVGVLVVLGVAFCFITKKGPFASGYGNMN